MKVLRVYHGGRQASHRERDRALVRAGADVMLVVPAAWPGSEMLVREDFAVVELPVTRVGDVNRHRYQQVSSFASYVDSFQPDVIDLHEEPFSSITAQVLQSLTLRYPIVGYTAQNIDKRFPPPFAQREHRALARLDGLYPCSQQAASVAVGKGFEGAVSILPLAPAAVFHQGRQSLDDEQVVLLLAGRMLASKGVVDAVRVVRAVRQAGHDAILELIGEGPEVETARRVAHQWGVGEFLRIQPWLSPPALADCYRRAHFVLAPSVATRTWVEQFGRMVVEAQASGAVVVGYASGALPEVVDNAGVVVAPHDHRAMSVAVIELLRNPNRWKGLRDLGLASVVNWDDIARRQLELYADAIGVRAVRPLVYRGGSRPSRASARRRFGLPAQIDGAERPFALPGLRHNTAVSRSLARVLDHFASTDPPPAPSSAPSIAGPTRLKVVYIDHVARFSGAEIALARMIDSLEDVDAHVILGEDGPLVAALERAGATVEVMPLRESTRDLRRAETANVRIVLGSVVDILAYSWRLSRRLRALAPDLVHTNSLKAGFYGTVAAKLAGRPVIWHVRDRIADDYLPGPTVLATRMMINYAPDLVLANSAETLRAATSLGRRANRGRAPLGVIAGVVGDVGPDASPRRPRMQRTIGMVGRLAPWKGQETFLRAFGRAFRGDPTMQARIIGAALFGEKEYEARLRRLIEELGLSDRVVLTGHVDDVMSEMRQLDVLVHASTIPEPFGLVVIEAMAVGLAVVATDAGGPSEIITAEVNGLLTPMGDVDALSVALRRLHDDAALRERLGAAAQIRAQDFAPEVIGPRVSAIYRQVLSRQQLPQSGRERVQVAS